jgi:hypothetical protein
MLIPAIFAAVAPLAMKPDDFGLLLIDREEDRPEVFVRWSARSIKVGEGCTEELVGRPSGTLAYCRAKAGAFASAVDESIRFVAHGT